MSNLKTLHIKDLPSAETEILADTPGAGDQTIYTAYSEPGVNNDNLKKCVIVRTQILADTPGAGDQTIKERYAVSSAEKNDQVVFDKDWADRTSLTYKILSW